jgi:pre-mRNA-splicing factor SYF1
LKERSAIDGGNIDSCLGSGWREISERMAMIDEYPIHDEDIAYELEVSKKPDDIRPWLRYVQFKQERPIIERAFVLERACKALPRSYKLWKMYLDLRTENLRGVDSRERPEEFIQVNVLFEKALTLLNKMPRIWIDYLNHLLRQTDVTKIRRMFDKALQALPTTQHDRIWPLYANFANTANPITCVCIWERYVQFDGSQIENYVEVLVREKFYQRAAEQLIKLINDPNFESMKAKGVFQLWEDLIDILVHHPREISSVDVEKTIRSGIARFTDQKGRLYVNLATYWISLGEYERARDVFEEGITSAMTVRDFTQVFDSYAEFEETLIAKMMEDSSIQDENKTEVDRRMEAFEQLMDRRPFVVNDVLLKQDPNNVVEWEKRAGLWGNDKQQVVNTYNKAIETISPKRANGKLSQLWVKFAKFYENGGDLATARTIFDKATKVPFKSVNELADIWIEWAEMELRHENFDTAIKVMANATVGPKKSRVNYFDETKSPQERLHKSIKVWLFYVDLVESVGELDEVRPLYDRIFELKIGTPLTVLNYANLLEENRYFEESFKVYERGIELFPYPTAFELWNVYLNKALKRKLGLERLRDLFEQALEHCPADMSKPFYLLYGKLEEDRGLIRNAVKIYDRATKSVADKDKLEIYRFYISRVAEHFGLPATRAIFQNAIDSLEDSSANMICQEFIAVEEKLGEIDRSRSLFGFASQFNNPRVSAEFWTKWEEFEKKYGTEETYKEMLRIKRSVLAQFNTDSHYIGTQAEELKNKLRQGQDIDKDQDSERETAMSMLEKQTNAPLGFVASTDSTQKEQYSSPLQESNPDKIDIDIDDM